MPMSNRLLKRLLAFEKAKRNAPRTTVVSRRSAKSMANGTGQVLKHSRIVSEVSLERIFVQFK